MSVFVMTSRLDNFLSISPSCLVLAYQRTSSVPAACVQKPRSQSWRWSTEIALWGNNLHSQYVLQKRQGHASRLRWRLFKKSLICTIEMLRRRSLWLSASCPYGRCPLQPYWPFHTARVAAVSPELHRTVQYWLDWIGGSVDLGPCSSSEYEHSTLTHWQDSTAGWETREIPLW